MIACSMASGGVAFMPDEIERITAKQQREGRKALNYKELTGAEKKMQAPKARKRGPSKVKRAA